MLTRVTVCVECTSTQLQPLATLLARPTLVGCGHKIVLRMDCLVVVQTFQDNMFFESICCEGDHAL